MISFWPSVFGEPLDAPYRPDLTPEQRRASAIADGLTAWGAVHLGHRPENFGDVLIKLAREAGMSSGSDTAFLAAADLLPKPSQEA